MALTDLLERQLQRAVEVVAGLHQHLLRTRLCVGRAVSELSWGMGTCH